MAHVALATGTLSVVAGLMGLVAAYMGSVIKIDL